MQDRIAFNQFLAETNKLTRIVLLSAFFSTVLWAAATTAVCPWHILASAAFAAQYVVQSYHWSWCNAGHGCVTGATLGAIDYFGACFGVTGAGLVQHWVPQVNFGAKDGKSRIGRLSPPVSHLDLH